MSVSPICCFCLVSVLLLHAHAQDVLHFSKDTVREQGFYCGNDSVFLANTTEDSVTVTSLVVEPLTAGMDIYHVEIHAVEYYALSNLGGSYYEDHRPIRVPPNGNVRMYAFVLDAYGPPVFKASATAELGYMDSLAVALIFEAAGQVDTLILLGWYHWPPNEISYRRGTAPGRAASEKLGRALFDLAGRVMRIPAACEPWRVTLPHQTTLPQRRGDGHAE